MTKILLADDVQLYLALEKTFLARRDYEFFTATTGPDALALLREEQPNLCILERTLPLLGAFDICRSVAGDEVLGKVPILVSTNDASAEVVLEAEGLGVGRLLVKPFSIDDLTSAVDALLPARRRGHERWDVHAEVGIRTERTVQYLTGSTLNLSVGGMLVEIPEPLSMGQTVWLQFLVGSDPHMIAVHARVVRYAKEQRRSGRCYGLEFLSLSDEDRLRVHRFLARRERRSGALPRALGQIASGEEAV